MRSFALPGKFSSDMGRIVSTVLPVLYHHSVAMNMSSDLCGVDVQ